MQQLKNYTPLAAVVLGLCLGVPPASAQVRPKPKPDVKAPAGKITLVDVGGFYKFGGDMLLDKEDPAHKAVIASLKSGKPVPKLRPPAEPPRRNLDPKPAGGVGKVTSPLTAGQGAFISKWPYGMVPYHYSGTFTVAERRAIEKAMRTIEDVCGVNFYEVSRGGANKLKIARTTDPNVGGTATVGRTRSSTFHFKGGDQGTIIHELLHVLGFIHEHQRHDRDRFVRVNWANIKKQYYHDFDKVPESAGLAFILPGVRQGKPLTSYDYSSIMHYSSFNSFAVDGRKPVIEKVGGGTVGGASSLSALDKEGLVRYYGASRTKRYYTTGEGFALGVTVQEIYGIDKSIDPLGKPDFYWVLELKDRTTFYNKWRSAVVNDKRTASRADWFAYRYYDHSPYSAFPTIECVLKVYDKDGGLRGKDDQCDINPKKGAKALSFVVDTRTGRISGDVNGSLNQLFTVSGGGDKDKARIKFRVTQLPVSAASTSAQAKYFHSYFVNGEVSAAQYNKQAWFSHKGGKGE